MNERHHIVFVVDDDASVRKSLVRLLKSMGYPARPYASAREFLDDWRHDPAPGCLVLDVQLPGLNGLELQEQLRGSAFPIPIIFITGHGDIPMSVRAMKAGAVDFLAKPFQDEDLVRAVQEAIAQHDQEQAEHAEREAVAGLLLDADAARARGDGAGRPRPPEQANRHRARDIREDGQGPPRSRDGENEAPIRRRLGPCLPEARDRAQAPGAAAMTTPHVCPVRLRRARCMGPKSHAWAESTGRTGCCIREYSVSNSSKRPNIRQCRNVRALIAIVDDDPSVRRALQRLLRSFGLRAETFHSGEGLLRALASSQISVAR